MALTKIGTDGVKDDAITSGKIPANAVGSSEIADQAVTLDKLPHGTSSNDGKFLRANNGADPSFETVSIPAGTTITNNADNRIVTGTGTANTLECETNLTYNGNNLTTKGADNSTSANTGGTGLAIQNTNNTNNNQNFLGFYDSTGTASAAIIAQHENHSSTTGNLQFGTRNAGSFGEHMRIVSSGEVGIGLTNPEAYGANGNGYAGLTVQAPSGSYSGITLRSGYNGAGSFQFADGSGSAAERRNGFIDFDHVNKRFNIGVDHVSKIRISEHGFHPNPSDSAAANALDDYEEGTYNPTLTGQGGGSISLYSGENTLTYTKVGNIVHVHGRIRLHIVNNTMSGQARLSLPFIAASGTGTSNQGQSSVATHGVTLSSSSDIGIFLETVGSSSNGYLNITRYSQSWTAVTANQFGGLGATSNHYLTFQHTYQAA